MALKDTIKDPLNWVLLVLAVAFAYYIIAIPYYQDHYLKEPQQLTMEEYLANPAHPRPFMLHALGTPPSSIEVTITGLTVKHMDTDSITLSSTGATGSGMSAGATQLGELPEPMLGAERTPPADEILIAGDNMDLLELSVGQQVDLQVHGLHESPLGWVPLEPTLTQDQEEFFDKDELDALDRMKIHANDNVVSVPYVETGELRFTDQNFPAGQLTTLEELANDTTYIQTQSGLNGAPVDIYQVRLVGKAQQQLAPYFNVEDDAGRRARVFFNQRLLSEWYWALDRLGNQPIVVRGVLRQLAPTELRRLESEEGNVQAVLDGLMLLSMDGSSVISLDDPSGGLGASPPSQQ